jgi:hypothetical protein
MGDAAAPGPPARRASLFRPSSPADADAIQHLMSGVFGMPGYHPAFRRDLMEWKYWADHPEWTGSRGYVMEREGKIIAHGSVIPLQCAWGDRRIPMVELIDWVALPDAAGAGITLLKKVGELTGGIFIAGGTEMAQKALKALGFKEVESAIQFAMPLRPFARLRAERLDSWRPLARYGRNLLWSMRAASSVPAEWTSRQIDARDLPSLSFPHPRPFMPEVAVFERSAQALSHFLTCPLTPSASYVVERAGIVCGYFVLAFAGAQCRIVDAWIEPPEGNKWDALYRLAAIAARSNPSAVELVTVASEPVAAMVLPRVGFVARGRLPLRIWIPKSDTPSTVRYQLIDNDIGFRQGVDDTFWA